MITSTSNKQIKNIIQLSKKPKVRKDQGLFLVEGIKMFEEAPSKEIEKVYISKSFLEHPSHVLLLKEKGFDPADSKYLEVVEDKVFTTISDTITPQGILCVIKQEKYEFKDFIVGKPLLLVIENLQDPGNLGTILRTGEAAGVTGIIINRTSVDIYNPKTIRSTMGSVYRVPFLYVDSLITSISKLKEHKIAVYAAHLAGKKDYYREDYTKGSAFLIGNEGNGLSEEIVQKADELIKIPMCGQVESLNAAMAAGVLLYEGYRQRTEL